MIFHYTNGNNGISMIIKAKTSLFFPYLLHRFTGQRPARLYMTVPSHRQNLHFRQESELPVCQIRGLNLSRKCTAANHYSNGANLLYNRQKMHRNFFSEDGMRYITINHYILVSNQFISNGEICWANKQ